MKILSPVAMGRWVPRAISASTSTFWQGTGSSTNMGWKGSSSLMRIFAVAGLIAPWKSMPMSISGPTASRSSPNFSPTSFTKPGGSMNRAGRSLKGPVLKAVKPSARFRRRSSGSAGVGVDPDPVAGGAAHQLVHRDPEGLALDVPEGLVDPAQGAGEDGAAPVERVAVDGLPVVHHLAGILPDQVGGDLLHRGGAPSSPAPR